MSKITSFSPSMPPTLSTLASDLKNVWTFLGQILNNLTFSENFNAKSVTVDFSGTGDIAIKNPLNNIIPTRWVVIDVLNTSDIFTPTRGVLSWDRDTLYLANPSGGTVTATILFINE